MKFDDFKMKQNGIKKKLDTMRKEGKNRIKQNMKIY